CPCHRRVPTSAETRRHGPSRCTAYVGGASEAVRFLSVHIERHPISAADGGNPDPKNPSCRRFLLAAWSPSDGCARIRSERLAMAAFSSIGACFRSDPATMLLLSGYPGSGPRVHARFHCGRLETVK